MTPPPLPTDQRIADLRSTLERTRANLVELDADMTRKTLESSTELEGRTAEAWSRASRQFAGLWQGQLALDAVLEEITRVRGTRTSIPRSSLAELHELLDGTPVALARSGPDAATRSLTEGTSPTEHLSIGEVITRMSADYQAVAGVLGTVDAVWTGALPGLEALRATVTELEAVAVSCGARRPNQLGLASQTLDEQERLARHDPLAFRPDALESLALAVEQAGRPIREAADAAREVVGELNAVQSSLDHSRDVLTQVRSDQDRPTARVAVPDSTLMDREAAAADLVGLQGQLDAARQTAQSDPVGARRVATLLTGLIAQLDQRIAGLGSIEVAGVAVRDELRGRLDALRAKALAMGRGEDPQLDRIHDEALDVLFSAPCDVRRAEDLVAEFQQALRSMQTGTS